jgi:hypothetical protein
VVVGVADAGDGHLHQYLTRRGGSSSIVSICRSSPTPCNTAA